MEPRVVIPCDSRQHGRVVAKKAARVPQRCVRLGGGGRLPNVSTGKTNSCWLKLTCAARDSYTCLHARALCTHSTSACRCYASVHMYVHMHTHIYTHEQPQIRLTTPCACMCPDATCALCKQAYFLSHAPDLGARVQLPKAWHAAVRLLAVIPNSA